MSTSFVQREQILAGLQAKVVQARNGLTQAQTQIGVVKTVADPTQFTSDVTAALADITAAAGDSSDIAAQYQQSRATKIVAEATTLSITAGLAGMLWTTCKGVLDTADLSNGLPDDTKSALLAAITSVLG